jgi:hypothetical protein
VAGVAQLRHLVDVDGQRGGGVFGGDQRVHRGGSIRRCTSSMTCRVRSTVWPRWY